MLSGSFITSEHKPLFTPISCAGIERDVANGSQLIQRHLLPSRKEEDLYGVAVLSNKQR